MSSPKKSLILLVFLAVFPALCSNLLAMRGGSFESMSGDPKLYGMNNIVSLNLGRCTGVFIQNDIILTATDCLKRTIGFTPTPDANEFAALPKKIDVGIGFEFSSVVYLNSPRAENPVTAEQITFTLIPSDTNPIKNHSKFILKSKRGFYVTKDVAHLTTGTISRSAALEFEIIRTDNDDTTPLNDHTIFKLMTANGWPEIVGTPAGSRIVLSPNFGIEAYRKFYFSKFQPNADGTYDVVVARPSFDRIEPARDTQWFMPNGGFLTFASSAQATHYKVLKENTKLALLVVDKNVAAYLPFGYEGRESTGLFSSLPLVLDAYSFPLNVPQDFANEKGLIKGWGGAIRKNRQALRVKNILFPCNPLPEKGSKLGCAELDLPTGTSASVSYEDMGSPILWRKKLPGGYEENYSVLGIATDFDNELKRVQFVPLFQTDSQYHTPHRIPADQPTLWKEIAASRKQSGCSQLAQKAAHSYSELKPLFAFEYVESSRTYDHTTAFDFNKLLTTEAEYAACYDGEYVSKLGLAPFRGIEGKIWAQKTGVPGEAKLLLRFGKMRSAALGDVLTTDLQFSSRPGHEEFRYAAVLGWILVPTTAPTENILPLNTWYHPVKKMYITSTASLWQGSTGDIKYGYQFVEKVGFVLKP